MKKKDGFYKDGDIRNDGLLRIAKLKEREEIALAKDRNEAIVRHGYVERGKR